MEVSLNSIIFIQMIAFLILLFILNIILYKPVLKVMAQREDTLNSLLNEANTLKNKALENEKNYQTRLQESEIKAKEEYNSIIAQAMKEKEESIGRETEATRQAINTEKEEINNALSKEYKEIDKYKEEISSKIYEQLVA